MRSRLFLIISSFLLILLGGVFYFFGQRAGNPLRSSFSRVFAATTLPFRSMAGVGQTAWLLATEIGSLPQIKHDFLLTERSLSEKDFLLQEKDIEIQQLRDALRLSQDTNLKMLTADTVGFVEGKLGGVILLNKGSDDGLKVPFPVFSPAGILVARVVEIGPKTAKALLISSPHSKLHVRLQQSRATGVLEGGWGSTLRISEIAKNAPIRDGEYVLTSGQDGLVLPGFLVGKVVSHRLREDQFFQEAEVDDLFDIQYLDALFVGLY